MSKFPTGQGSEPCSTTMPHKTAQEETEPQTIAMSVSLAQAGLGLQTKVKPEASSHEPTEAENALSPDSSFPHDSSSPSSEDGSDAVSQNGSNDSSPNSSPPTSPESIQTTFPVDKKFKTSNFVDTSLKDKIRPRLTTISSTSSQFDSDTETLCDSASQDDSETASDDDPGFKHLSAICNDCFEGGPEFEDAIVWQGRNLSEDFDVFYKPGPDNLLPDGSTSSYGHIGDQARRPKGSQHVAAYASPAQDGRRIRTSCDRNDDTGMWHVEYDGFIDEAHRVGGPYLCSEAVATKEMDHPLKMALEDYTLVQKIKSLLTESNINPTTMKLRHCQCVERGDELVPTLTFEATRVNFDQTWLQASRKIWRLLSDNKIGQVSIEIKDPGLYIDQYVWFDSRDDPLPSGEAELSQLRWSMRHKFDLSGVCHQGFDRVGSSPEKEKSQLVYLVDVNYRVKRDWRASREAIVKALDEANLHTVGVLITKTTGQVTYWTG